MEFPKSVEVTVSQASIDIGERGHCGLCPIALELDTLVKGNPNYMQERSSVGSFRATLKTINGESLYYVLPKVARLFVQRFDCNLSVKPFTFTITLGCVRQPS